MNRVSTKSNLNPIERSLYRNIIRPLTKKFNKKISSAIPKYELTDEHVKNAKLLATREDLLKLLPKDGVVAELGVDTGGFSEKIFSITSPKKMHLIDLWGDKRYNQLKRAGVEAKFAKEIKEGNVEINLGLSTEVVNQFEDGYFDWIYIDTSHSYETTFAELELYKTKLKKDGIIAGHDYIVGNWEGNVRYGVIEAVHEFCVKDKWEILYITNELYIKPSFAIRKIIA
jgi:hypothetical protein